MRGTAKTSIGMLLAIVAAMLMVSAPAMAAGGAGMGSSTTKSSASAKKKTKAKKTKKKKKATKKKKAASTTTTTTTTTTATPTTTVPSTGGGAGFGSTTKSLDAVDQPTVVGSRAKIVKGTAYAPSLAPDSVKQAIWAANKIIGRPYVYGGGHASFKSHGYDCSGTVSYALHGGNLLDEPADSSVFMGWGKSGRGQWITIFANPEHAYMVIAGIRLDTSAADDPNGKSGPRWRPLRHSNAGFDVRHPAGL